MKRKAKQNAWGNWNGYEGRRRVHEFGTSDIDAGYWVLTGSIERNAGYSSKEMIKKCRDAIGKK